MSVARDLTVPALRTRLTIQSIETVAIRVPLARTYRGSGYKMTHRSTLITRIVTDDGLFGEAYSGDEDAGLAEIEKIVRDELSPVLIGEDAFAVERLWQLTRPATFDILRDRRLGLVACACVDTAVWGLIGQGPAPPPRRTLGAYPKR